MGFRLSRRVKIAKGLHLNVSKSGLSVSAGPRGAKVTIGKKGVRTTVGVPGTGMSYTKLHKSESLSQTRGLIYFFLFILAMATLAIIATIFTGKH